jgi:putative spermidine/putrescine transport system permease protein
VVINLLGKRDAFISVAVSLAALLFAFVLIFGIAVVAGGRRQAVEEPIEEGVV